jgi:hypothetical protein
VATSSGDSSKGRNASYEFQKQHATQPDEAFSLYGSNSKYEWQSVSVSQLYQGGRARISASGGWMDRTKPVTTMQVEIVLARAEKDGEYALMALNLEGKSIDLEPIANQCRFE